MISFDPTPDIGTEEKKPAAAPVFGVGNLTEAPKSEPDTRLPSERLNVSQSERMHAEADKHFAGGAR